MQRFGQTLDFYLTEHEDLFSFKTTMQIGIQLIKVIEEFHSIGCVHNDLKLDNICVGMPSLTDNLTSIKLIDFGIATSYSKSTSLFKVPPNDDEHIEQVSQRFKGNYGFCSPNALLHKSTSRRDDLISILYILLFLSTLKVPFMDDYLDSNERESLYKKQKIS